MLFNRKEQLSPLVVERTRVTFERLMKDGEFSQPQEVLEWIPESSLPLVYRTGGVVHCLNVADFGLTSHARKEGRPSLSTPFSTFTTLILCFSCHNAIPCVASPLVSYWRHCRHIRFVTPDFET